MAYIAPTQTNPNDPNEQQGPSSQPSATGMSTPSSNSQASATPASATQAPSSQPKGSGRFTNIQKYMQANQGAGQRLAGGVEARVQSKVNPQAQQAQTQAQNVREGIQSAQGKLQQGQQLRSQVEQKDFDAQGFAAQEPNVQQFTQFRTGQAIDENALRGQAEQAQMQAMQAQQAAQGFGQQLGTEQGRQQLLKQTFSPTRNYTIGQQRLDNLFLQQASPQLQKLQQNLNLTGQQLGNLSTEAQEKQKAIQALVGDETALAQGLQSAIGAREQDVVSAAEARAEEVNQARQAAQEQARTQFQNLLEGKEINQDFAGQLGLTEQDRLYNVLRDQGGVDNYLKFNPTLLQGANQLASQDQRQRYDAIARLAGLAQDQRRIGLEDKTQAAVESTGKLRTSLDEAARKFQEQAAKDYTSTGQQGIFSATSTQNLNQVLPLAKQLRTANLGSSNFYLDQAYNRAPQETLNLISQLQSQTAIPNTSLSGVSLLDTGKNWLTNTAKYQALRDAYARLGQEGYYNQARIANPTLKKLPEPT